jgi:hypothetical protein
LSLLFDLHANLEVTLPTRILDNDIGDLTESVIVSDVERIVIKHSTFSVEHRIASTTMMRFAFNRVDTVSVVGHDPLESITDSVLSLRLIHGLPCPCVFAVETARILGTTRNEQFTVSLVRVDDSRNRLESVLVRAIDAVFRIGNKLEARSGNLVATVETLTHR